MMDPAGEPSDEAGTSSGAGDSGTTGLDDGSTGGDEHPGSTGELGSTGGEDESTGALATTGDDEGSSTGVQADGSSGETVLHVDELLPGDLVVTEVMWNPSCSLDACEWIEILNTTDAPVSLADLYVQDIDYDPGNQGRVTLDVVVAPGEVAVIVRGVSFWPYDFEPDAVYGPNPGLNNGSPDRVVLRSETAIIDETPTFSIDHPEGVAWSLSTSYLDAVANDDSAHWCDATEPLPTVSTTELGTPGVLDSPC
ncbi:MAG: lamin tail domain-containing protein [Myxococcales bacterium]|nr:lamin tail domain-containing protein [Myxococcales bacterium]MCB9718420.1 lamin tail domain-containing protein [Myxococcales bacterium]